MSTKQLLVLIGAVTALTLGLAWVIEQAQTRALMREFDEWWNAKARSDAGNAGPD